MLIKTQKALRLVYGIVLSVAIAITGICLIGACLSIYRSGGDQIYTPEKVSQAFSNIAVPVFLCLLLIVGRFILELVLPSQSGTRKAIRRPEIVLQRLQKTADMDICGPTLRKDIEALERGRRCHVLIALGLLTLGIVIFLIYSLNSSHFHQTEINTSVINAMAVMLPCLGIPFGYGVFTAYYCRGSIQRQIELVKQVPKKAAESTPSPAGEAARYVSWLKWGLLVLAAFLLVYGFFAGGTADVLTKAINICTECVGLG